MTFQHAVSYLLEFIWDSMEHIRPDG